MSNIKPKTEATKVGDKPKTEKKCTWCNRPRHEQPECWDFLKVVKQLNEARAASQGNSQQRGGRGGNRRGGNRGNGRGRGRGRGGASRTISHVDIEGGEEPPTSPAPAVPETEI